MRVTKDIQLQDSKTRVSKRAQKVTANLGSRIQQKFGQNKHFFSGENKANASLADRT